jgi:predicted RNA binding protein YcfA (HicA-like mRNA interferase family)
MGKVPPLKARQVAAILHKLGFEEVRQRGSHKQFRNRAGRNTTVPFHRGRDVSPSRVRRIAEDIGITIEEFLSHR